MSGAADREKRLDEALDLLIWSLNLRNKRERETHRRQAREVLDAVRAERAAEVAS